LWKRVRIRGEEREDYGGREGILGLKSGIISEGLRKD
jgi:hypothetical protein